MDHFKQAYAAGYTSFMKASQELLPEPGISDLARMGVSGNIRGVMDNAPNVDWKQYSPHIGALLGALLGGGIGSQTSDNPSMPWLLSALGGVGGYAAGQHYLNKRSQDSAFFREGPPETPDWAYPLAGAGLLGGSAMALREAGGAGNRARHIPVPGGGSAVDGGKAYGTLADLLGYSDEMYASDPSYLTRKSISDALQNEMGVAGPVGRAARSAIQHPGYAEGGVDFAQAAARAGKRSGRFGVLGALLGIGGLGAGLAGPALHRQFAGGGDEGAA